MKVHILRNGDWIKVYSTHAKADAKFREEVEKDVDKTIAKDYKHLAGFQNELAKTKRDLIFVYSKHWSITSLEVN